MSNSETSRPTDLSTYFGQDEIKNNLKVFINSSLEREAPLDHTLLFGPPGLGKTSLAMVMGAEMETKTHVVSAPSIEKISDLVPLLASIESFEVLFIDEIHRLPIAVEEILYSAMEDFKIDIILESGSKKKVIPIILEPFTLVGATTRTGLISKPMKDRFGIQFQLKEYSPAELAQIISAFAAKEGMSITEDASLMIAERSRFTPRIALGLYKRSRDFALYGDDCEVDIDIVELCFNRMNIDSNGLNSLDLEYLDILKKDPLKSFGLKTISTLLNHDIRTIEDDIEPYLLRLGLIEKTPSGRKLS